MWFSTFGGSITQCGSPPLEGVPPNVVLHLWTGVPPNVVLHLWSHKGVDVVKVHWRLGICNLQQLNF